ncbi:MAG: hypothetical protein MUP21_05235 [Dehalococcoidia bacterium]|nr:hypothetical protein [Dehalococcoidia bacterium]
MKKLLVIILYPFTFAAGFVVGFASRWKIEFKQAYDKALREAERKERGDK